MILGVDIASPDRNRTNWPAARRAGVRFAVFRAAYGTWPDPTWRAERLMAAEAGIVVGAYLFPRIGIGHPSPEVQVATLAEYVELGVGDLPATLDVEFPGGIAATGLTRRGVLEWVARALRAMRRAFGVPPMVYSSRRVWDGEDADAMDADASGIDLSEFADSPLWLARYGWPARSPAIGDDPDERDDVDRLAWPPVPSTWGGDPDAVWIHQYQGDALGARGFTSTVDLNRFRALRRGAVGWRVRWLQRRLGREITGVFDDGLDAAVRELQRRYSLAVDGIVGPATFAVAAWCTGPELPPPRNITATR